LGEVLRRKVNQLKNKIMSLSKPERRQRIRFRIRKSISGTAKPRLSVFRSNKEIYAQLIDDVNGVTFLLLFKRKEIGKGTNVDVATVGKLCRESVKGWDRSSNIDRGGYLYHGRIKSLAEGARAAGLKF
jgi:large subunit ribosomal protein L18